jgi:hypothetical protein
MTQQAIDPYTQARYDLSSSVGAQIVAGDTAWTAGNYSAATTAYQQAGQMGATIIGPEIDAAGYPQATQKFTQQAWQLNAQLAQIPSTNATQANALNAQLLAGKIQQLYIGAMDAGTRAASPPTPSNLPIWLALGGLAVVGGIVFGLHARSGGGSGPPRPFPRESRVPTRRVLTARPLSPSRQRSQAPTRRVDGTSRAVTRRT